MLACSCSIFEYRKLSNVNVILNLHPSHIHLIDWVKYLSIPSKSRFSFYPKNQKCTQKTCPYTHAKHCQGVVLPQTALVFIFNPFLIRMECEVVWDEIEYLGILSGNKFNESVTFQSIP